MNTSRLSTEIITTIAGIVAAALMVTLNEVLQRSLDLDLLGLTYAFVIPAGAIIGGLGAAAGYYIAARLTSTLPSRRMLFEMLAIGVSTWMLMHWVEYATLRYPDGRLVRDSWPFWDYFRVRTEHLRLTMQNAGGRPTGATSELGLLGYAHELVQVAGFLCGGFIMWAALKSEEACHSCSRYARSLKLLQRASSAVFDEFLRRAEVELPSFGERVRQKVGKLRLIGLNLSLSTCPSCRRSWLRPAVVVMQGNHAVAQRMDAYDLTAAQAATVQSSAPKKAA